MKTSCRPPILPVLAVLALLGVSSSHAGETEGFLYWTAVENGEVWRATTAGVDIEQLTTALESRVAEVDTINGRIYYFAYPPLENDLGHIYRANLDGTERQALVPAADTFDIDLDIPGGKVYWAETSPSDRIRRANLDGTGAETVVSGASNSTALGLDLGAGRLYYRNGTTIRSALLDGSDDQLVVDTGNGVGDIEIDETNDKLYYSSFSVQGVFWCDLGGTDCAQLASDANGSVELTDSHVYYHVFPNVWRMDLDGGNQTQVTAGPAVRNYFDLDAEAGHIYASERSLFRIDVDGTNVVPLVALPGTGVHDVAIDPDAGILYFSDFAHNVIARTAIDPVVPVQLFIDETSTDEVRGLAFDPVGGRLYWANTDGPGGIWSAATDGSDVTEIVPGLTKPHDVAVDSTAGKIYWTENIDTSGTGGAIRRAELGGGNVEDILLGLPQTVRGIDLHPLAGKIYWTDHGSDEIWWADLDGSDPAAILSANNPHDVAVDLGANTLYWTEGISDDDDPLASIRRSNLDGTSPSDFLTGLSRYIRDLTVAYLPVPPPIFEDGFESGDTSLWSQTVE